jgi:WD repeat-containing protein 26
MLRLV